MVWRQKSCWLNLGDLNIHVARCGHSSQAGSSLQHAEINEKIISEICFAYKGWLLFTSHEFRLVRLWCVCLCVCSHLNEQSGSVKQNCETVNITSTIVTRELSRCLASALFSSSSRLVSSHPCSFQYFCFLFLFTGAIPSEKPASHVPPKAEELSRSSGHKKGEWPC